MESTHFHKLERSSPRPAMPSSWFPMCAAFFIPFVVIVAAIVEVFT